MESEGWARGAISGFRQNLEFFGAEALDFSNGGHQTDLTDLVGAARNDLGFRV